MYENHFANQVSFAEILSLKSSSLRVKIDCQNMPYYYVLISWKMLGAVVTAIKLNFMTTESLRHLYTVGNTTRI